VAVQRALAERNSGSPDDWRIELRVGICLGDVIVEGSDLYGNGVNIAARMEGLAEPGGICISGNVYEHVGQSRALEFDDLGDQTVKNIEKPVRCYRVRIEHSEASEVDVQPPSVGPKFSDKPSIAVLAFDNLSGDPDQEFFSDGLAEDIITALSKIERMRVIARNSTFAYKGRALDLRRIADELGVRYVL
jgi:adenylate cyclase